MQNLLAVNHIQSMSSREIAELVESRHDNVKLSMERLAAKGIISFTSSAETSHDGAGARPVAVYLVGKRDSYIIVAQMSPLFTARLVDRWQELEAAQAPALPSYPEALRALASSLEHIQVQQAQIESQKPAVEFVERYVESSGNKGFREVCKLLKANENKFKEFLLDSQIMYRLGGRLMPMANHLDAKRFEVSAGIGENDHAFTTAKFTPKGINWVAGLWAVHNLQN